ncbi:MAG: trigger factor [Lachnospiraceae bacterium]|nr:trigger factor [Lachnospiraceae bacterium]MBQ7600852.1 trigger factor [Lachnospiraceae bacterium]
MGLKVEKQEGNMALLTIDVPAEEFDKATERAYQKQKGKINIQGFRRGHAPRALIEKMYGEGVFFEDAANELIEKTYFEALESEEGKALDIVSRPEIDVTEMGKGKDFVYTARVALKPEAVLGQYKDLGVEKKTAEVTDEDVEKEIDKTRELNSRLVTVEDRPVQDGDTAVIDFEGFIDGTPFEGGKGEDHELTIGSHSFIDTFEEQLIGHNAGDEVDVNVTFPQDYKAEELAGKPALFKVTVKAVKVKEIPAADDEFASEVSEFETMAEYRESVRKNLAEKKEKDLKDEYRNECLKKAVENATLEIPEAMIDYQAEQLVNDYAQRLQAQGLSMDMFLKYTGQTINQVKDSYKAQAKTRIQNSLVLEAVAKAENVKVSEEEVDNEIAEMAKSYQMETEKLKELLSEEERDNLKKSVEARKALDVIAG